jgi:large subunit ribosomal protein L29
MDAEKIRNLTGEELSHQEKDMSDQLFKLKFQLNMGQTESLTKIRGLRKDIARVKTIVRERAGGAGAEASTGNLAVTSAVASVATTSVARKTVKSKLKPTVKTTVKSKSEKK